MVRKKKVTKKLPRVENGYLNEPFIKVGSPEWYTWLDSLLTVSFRYVCRNGFDAITIRKSKKGYWNAFRKVNGKTRNKYIGQSHSVSEGKLCEIEDILLEPCYKVKTLLDEFYERRHNT